MIGALPLAATRLTNLYFCMVVRLSSYSGVGFIMVEKNLKVKLYSTSHAVGEANYHLQFTPKYRRDIFADEIVRFACEEVFKCIAKRLGVQLAGIGFGSNHVHLFVTHAKNYGASQLAKRFKGASSRALRKELWDRIKGKLWGKAFWTRSHMHRTVGHVNYETMKKYVNEGQSKHWEVTPEKRSKEQGQLTLLKFVGNQC